MTNDASAGQLLVRIGRLAVLIHRTQRAQTITLETFKHLMAQMAVAVAQVIDAPQALAPIERRWQAIRLPS
jgi:hypothetical protein